MKYQLGTSKKDMTCFIPQIGMMGYGQPHNYVTEIATPLLARALFLKADKSQFILVHLEQAFVTLAIKEEVLIRLKLSNPEWNINDANLAITAQHTHSAPGGYSHYPFYNFTIPNFQLKVFETVVNAIIDAIKEASISLQDTFLSWGETEIHESKEVAFNRSISAHALNPEAIHFNEDQKHLAVDRKMEGLFFKTLEGKTVAFINFFGVHCTSVSSFNTKIHHDNKGIAAALYEKHHPETTAFFLQGSAGDVSPNFIWDQSLKRNRGKFKDQYESAEYNGEIQFREAEKITPHQEISGYLESHQIFMDMAKEVASPAHGVAFFKGTAEGPGVPAVLGFFLSQVSKLVKQVHLIKDPSFHQKFYAAHGSKDVLLDHRIGSFVGLPLSSWKYLPPIPDPAVDSFRITAKNNALETLPWVPSILPFQILTLGNIAIAFVPGEITVMAGRRLKHHLLNELKDLGVSKVFLTSYANAYMGYIVTPEEYDIQAYEGGHTVYGRHTLDGIIKGFNQIILKMKGKKTDAHISDGPFHFPAEELARRSI